MIFTLSKVVGFLLKPLVWMTGLAALSIWSRSTRWKRRFLYGLFALLLISSNRFLVNICAHAWEDTAGDIRRLPDTCTIGILLGGYLDVDASQDGNVALYRSGSRLLSALQLYKAGKIKYILLSGGSGRALHYQQPEAHLARRLLIALGVPDSALLVEDASRNTVENARYSRLLLEKRGLSTRSTVLISSTWHLPRARYIFIRAGLVPAACYGTDPLYERKPAMYLWQPSWEALMKWELLIKEWVGYVFVQF